MDNQEKDVLIKFGQNIRKNREKRKMTINDLSNKTGISVHYLKKIEIGKACRINSKYIFIFAEAFNIEPCELVKGM